MGGGLHPLKKEVGLKGPPSSFLIFELLCQFWRIIGRGHYAHPLPLTSWAPNLTKMLDPIGWTF